MEKNPKVNTEAYLNKMEQADISISAEELLLSHERLNKPFAGMSREGDSVRIVEGDAEMHIQYAPYTYEDRGVQYEDKSMKRVKALSFAIDGGVVDIFDILPEGQQILVSPDSDKKRGHVMMKDKHGIRTISLLGDLDSPRMLAILFHEIGHVIDFEKLDRFGLETLTDVHDNSDIAEVIRRERAATAFALKALKPFLRNKQLRRDMINLLKYDALGSYYIGAREDIRKRLKKSTELSDHFFAHADEYYELV